MDVFLPTSFLFIARMNSTEADKCVTVISATGTFGDPSIEETYLRDHRVILLHLPASIDCAGMLPRARFDMRLDQRLVKLFTSAQELLVAHWTRSGIIQLETRKATEQWRTEKIRRCHAPCG